MILLVIVFGASQVAGLEASAPHPRYRGQNQFISLAGKATPHIGDQLMLHVNFQFKKLPMTLDEIQAESESVVELDVPAIP